MIPEKGFVYPDLSHLFVILVEPQTPGNIGSVARIMKNFGVSQLRLVAPCDHLHKEARYMAVHAEEILEKAAIFSDFPSALADIRLSVATTNRRRETHFPSFNPNEAASKMTEAKPGTKMACVFGNERDGLSTEQIHTCNFTVTIPTSPLQSSLNLSHAVGIILYEVFQRILDGNPNFVWDHAEPSEVEILYQRIRKVLEVVEFKPRKTNEDFILGVKRVLGRTPLEDRDVRLFHKIFQEIESYINRLKR